MSPLVIISQLDTLPFFFVLAGSFLPALLWLWFWCREDKARPEPPIMLILTFLGGMASVFTALVAQNYLVSHHIRSDTFSTIFLYVATEELSKFFFAYIIALRSRSDDEPIDPIIYMIASALGFSALENALFITGSFLENGSMGGITIGVLRFLGATLLHILASSAIGVSIGLAFYKKSGVKFIYAVLGTIAAISLHASFNLLIIGYGDSGSLYVLFFVFAPFWAAMLGLILCFELVKKVSPFPTYIHPPQPLAVK
jgi:RsiW-degrading membrane proteinase PrsW (M82 family)